MSENVGPVQLCLTANLHRLVDLLARPDELPALPYISSDTDGGVLVNWFLWFNFDSLAEQRSAAAEIFLIIGGTWDQDEEDENQTRYLQAFEGLIPDEDQGLTLGVSVGGAHDGPVSTTSQEILARAAWILRLSGHAGNRRCADGRAVSVADR